MKKISIKKTLSIILSLAMMIGLIECQSEHRQFLILKKQP